MGGSAILMEEWRHLPNGIMMIWYPGMEGGYAFADIVFGDRASSELRAFKKVHIEAGQSQTVAIALPVSKLAFLNEAKDDFVVEKTIYEFSVRSHSKDLDARSDSIAVI
eukprot:s1_g866.t1